MIKKISKKFKKVNSQKGFTLLEILVVLTIMGFLIAMVAPRLAGISGSAVDTVCDSNQNRMVTYMSTYYEQTNGYPNKLTNLVMQDSGAAAAADYQIPVVSDQDPENGAEVFANELYSRNHFYIHYLDADEAAELKDMGIITVFNLNDYSQIVDAVANPANYLNDVPHAAVGTQEASMDPVTPVLNVGVAMVGVGYNGAAWASAAEERGWGEPANFGRIVLGMGTECGLITSGIISNAAHCPGGIQNDDNVTYNDYILLLPRLEATAARMDGVVPLGTIAAPAALGCVAYDDDPTPAYDYVANADNYRVRTFDITEAQEGWQFATMCPEGHMYPADDEEFWGVDIDGLTGIN
jgi:prepilin-type N-terminal cleavage/methylation domain-containing protein